MDSLVIGSRLDSEVNANACRLAFSGRLVERYDAKLDNGRIKTYTKKEKAGTVCRLGDPYRRADDDKLVRYEVFGTDLFKKETNMSQFVGLLIETDRGDVGSIQSSFGTSGKFRVNFPGGTDVREGDSLYLRFKRYANDPKKAIHQDGTLPPARTGSRVDPPAKKKKNKAKNGSRNDAIVPTSPQTMTENNPTKNSDCEKFGEVVKLKGDVLDNGKSTMAIISGLFSMEDDITQHKGRKVLCTTTEEEGAVDGSFGKMGKCKVSFKDGVSAEVGSRVKMPGRYLYI
jgi:selenocysteine-specific elongation factor